MWLSIHVHVVMIQPFPKQRILDSSKLKEFVNDNFKFDENGRKFSKLAENTIGKGEITRYEQSFLSNSVFKKRVRQANGACLGKVKVLHVNRAFSEPGVSFFLSRQQFFGKKKKSDPENLLRFSTITLRAVTIYFCTLQNR